MALNAELTSFYDNLHRTLPTKVSVAFKTAAKDHEAAFDRNAAVQVGDKLPDFSLLDTTGERWSKDALLAKGPLLISFYRGGWCPICNIELRALQKYSKLIQGQGVTLVAISPDAPDDSRSRKEKMGLDFAMLSDSHNELAHKLGIVNKQPESLRPGLSLIDSSFRNPEKAMAVPIPATILVDKSGTVRQTYVNPKYHERLEPGIALGWIEKLQK